MKLNVLLDHIPRVFAASYSTAVIVWWMMHHSLLPHWYAWLAAVGAVYALKDFYLEGDAKLRAGELDKYPSWVRNHAVYSLDGYARIRRRILAAARKVKVGD